MISHHHAPQNSYDTRMPGTLGSASVGQLRELADFFKKHPELKIGVVIARFNDHITEKLRQGAVETLEQCGVAPKHIYEVWVPGAVELPLAAQDLLDRGADAVVCLGCVIRGDTDHYTYVCNMATNGIQQVALDYGQPVSFGVLTCETEAQALARIYPMNDPEHWMLNPVGNKGADAARTVLEMLYVQWQLPETLV